MNILAIETSCDDTAAAVVEDGRKVLSAVVASQIQEHIQFGGVVPEIASRQHTENIADVVAVAMRTAALDYDMLDAVAVTAAPGLIGALLVGVSFAKGLAYSSGLPLVPVHHLRGHIASNYICHPDLEPPFTALVVSGGHSHLIRVNGYTDFTVLGRTRDDAAGEALDKAARAMGLDYPGGANLDKAAADGNDRAYEFPHPRVEGSPLDFSFSGLKTQVLNTINSANQRGETVSVPDLGASYIKAVADCLIKRAELALDMTGDGKFVIAGGVSANSVLRRRAEKMCEKRKIKLYKPELRFCGDNAAMIGAQGFYELAAGHTASLKLNAKATMEIDAAFPA
ncbi:MAG: tRNA (adenosine(37)-N6)-threonylcarbamoyltransferase complex transferase subunit TsaD, partial [Clostridiales bacterium]|nr:tRNA (adenosine(37)-N6)-threonylcarbamoyltransferase complex transferase subunit TsaD [Clostridiales bacterium]